MLTPDEITKEVKDVFGEDARVEIKLSAKADGYYIEVHKRVGKELLMVSACIPAIEELESESPLMVLRQYIGYMYYYYLQALEQDMDDGDVRDAQRKTGRKDKGSGGGSTTLH